MTHLEVTPEGIFVIENCPEEPNREDFKRGPKGDRYFAHNAYDVAMAKYQAALASCKRIRCADQQQAAELCWRNDRNIHNPMPFLFWKENRMKPGIYSLPDVEWERQGVCCSPLPPNINHQGDCDTCQQYSEVAILKESQQEDIDLKEESQEDASEELYDFLDNEGRNEDQYDYGLPILSARDEIIKRMKVKFTITRK